MDLLRNYMVKGESFELFELKNGYSVRQDDEYNALFKNGKPTNILKRDNTKIYNKIFKFKPRVKSVEMKKDKISLEFIIEKTNKKNKADLKKFVIKIDYNEYPFFEKGDHGTFQVDIPYEQINTSGRIAGIYLYFEDEYGFTFQRKFLSSDGPHDKKTDHDLFYSKIKTYKNHKVFVYETWAGYLSLTYREKNVTDSVIQQKKIELAYKKYKKDFKDGKNEPSIVLFEKFCEKYEESARYVYEKLIDDGWNNVYFILDKKSKAESKIPKKYRKNIIDKYSFKHYYELFNAKAFISTETMNHLVDLSIYNPLIRRRQMLDDYYYLFLQHGVSYIYYFKARNDFRKGFGFRDNCFVAVSSEKEARHFIEDGKFDWEDLIISGMPKFDHSIQNENADRILIMPTTRNFEYSVIRDDTENSSYYKFSKNVIESVPDELEDKITYIPHPLINKVMGKTDLEKYMPDEVNYDELLKDTCLLITDYSSISYDAFYRGANVIFCWVDREMCEENTGLDVVLNEENAFGDIAYDYQTLGELISKNYNAPHSEENLNKFREIVEFHDGKNTERFIEYIYNTNIFPKGNEDFKMEDAIITGLNDYPYTGKPVTNTKINVSHNGKKLVKNLDYEIKFHDNVDVGTARCDIIGKGIYSGTKTVDFEIKKNIKKSKFNINGDDITINFENSELSEGIDYICEEVDYPGIDLKKIIFRGIGDFIGQKRILIDLSNTKP